MRHVCNACVEYHQGVSVLGSARSYRRIVAANLEAEMDHTRMLVANEPLFYRDTMAAAFRKLRPQAEVIVAEPGDLDTEVLRLTPDLVFCSGLSEVVETRSSSWVVHYPGGQSRVEMSVGGARTGATDVELRDLVSIIDRASPA